MDSKRFDSLTRSLAAPKTRRGVLGSLAAFGVGLLSSHGTDAQVTQVQCGNKSCRTNPGKCNDGCVCCVYGNGNSRCRPAGQCAPGVVLCPPGQVLDPSGVCVAPTTTTTTTTTTTVAPGSCGDANGTCPDGCLCVVKVGAGPSWVCVPFPFTGSLQFCSGQCPVGEVCVAGPQCMTACSTGT